MNKNFILAGFAVLSLSGCGMQGPLYLPPNPDDSYLSRIEKTLNEMTGQTTAVIAEPKDDANIDITDPDKLEVKADGAVSRANKTDAAESESKPVAHPVVPESNVIHESDESSAEK